MNLAEKKNFVVNFLYFLFCGLILYFVFKIAFTYLFPFVIAFFIAWLVQKPAKLIAKKTKIKKDICAAILSAVIYLIIVVLSALFLWILYTQIKSVFNNFEQIKQITIGTIKRIKNYFKINDSVKIYFEEFISNAIERLTSIFASTATNFITKMPEFFVSGIITIVASCYVAKDFDKFLEFIKGIISNDVYKKAVDIIDVFKECFFKFIVGYFWLFIITFFELLIGFFILGINRFFLLALLVAFIDILPILGTGIVLIPWSIILLLKGNFLLGFGIISLYLIISFVRNFSEAKIIGDKIDINPIFTLTFIFLGLRIGGILGMLVFPLTLTAVFTYLRRKISTDNTADNA